MNLHVTLLALAIALWLLGASLLMFGDDIAWRVVGAVAFAAGIGLGFWSVYRGAKRGRDRGPLE
jgi:hypothetical protein